MIVLTLLSLFSEIKHSYSYSYLPIALDSLPEIGLDLDDHGLDMDDPGRDLAEAGLGLVVPSAGRGVRGRGVAALRDSRSSLSNVDPG